MPGETGNGAFREAVSYEDKPLVERSGALQDLFLVRGERTVEEAEHRGESSLREPEHAFDLRGEIEQRAALLRSSQAVEAEDLKCCAELRWEEVPRGIVFLDGEAGICDEFSARIIDRDRESALEESLRAVSRAEELDCRGLEADRRKRVMMRIEGLQGKRRRSTICLDCSMLIWCGKLLAT